MPKVRIAADHDKEIQPWASSAAMGPEEDLAAKDPMSVASNSCSHLFSGHVHFCNSWHITSSTTVTLTLHVAGYLNHESVTTGK